jgi:hypothetical protein
MARRSAPDPLAAPGTEGLSEFDRDRAGTLADEGGASAATVESTRTLDDHFGEGPSSNGRWRTAALVAGASLAVLAVWTALRRLGARGEKA